VIRLSERVRLVRADNPSPMTLEGTNTYLVGDGDLLIIDPGPDDAQHLHAVRETVGDAHVTAILLTHRHHDHSDGARTFAEAFDAHVAAFGGPDYLAEVSVADGARVGGRGTFLTAVHTPGHASDHVCFVLEEENVLFSGDHVLGRGTTIIAFPDGDMAAYMASLQRVRELKPQRIFPGHGPIVDDPERVLDEYVEHRLMRERQVVEALRHGPGTPMDLVERIYTDVDPKLHAAAEFNVRAHLDKLAHEKRAREDDDLWSAT
jgi:glyoxylase-like metal-dependent hydrolase (beta-lactamase superfamily II)